MCSFIYIFTVPSKKYLWLGSFVFIPIVTFVVGIYNSDHIDNDNTDNSNNNNSNNSRNNTNISNSNNNDDNNNNKKNSNHNSNNNEFKTSKFTQSQLCTAPPILYFCSVSNFVSAIAFVSGHVYFNRKFLEIIT